MADQNQRAALARELQRLEMDFGHQWAGGINHTQLPLLSFDAHPRWNAMSAENEYRAFGNLFDSLYENRATAAQLVNHIAVVNDFVVNENGPPVARQRQFHDITRTNHTGAKSTRTHSHERLGAMV